MGSTDIVFCPGLDGSASEIADVADMLSPAIELDIVRYPGDTTINAKGLAAIAAACLRKLPEGRRLLVGCSFGGFVAIQTILRYPKLVDRLCLLVTFNHEPLPLTATLGIALAGVLPKTGTKTFARVLARKITRKRLSAPQRKKFASAIAEIDPFVMAARAKLFKGWDVRGRLAEIGIPVEIIYATRDGISGTRAQIKGWAGLRDARLTGLKSGHVLPITRPKELARIMSSWAQSVGAAQ